MNVKQALFFCINVSGVDSFVKKVGVVKTVRTA